MSSRIPNFAPPGSLLKQPRFVKPKRKGGRERMRDDSYLSLIRQCPCIACGLDPAGEAAHVRTASAAHGKPSPGMQVKPDDRWALPLCHEDHMRQHEVGELSFWYDLGLNPVLVCTKLQAFAQNLDAMRTQCFAIYEMTKD